MVLKNISVKKYSPGLSMWKSHGTSCLNMGIFIFYLIVWTDRNQPYDNDSPLRLWIGNI